MIGGAFSSLASRRIRQRSGLCSNFGMLFHGRVCYLLRDRDRIFGEEFVHQVKAMGIKQVLSAPRSPWQRAYVERLIGSIRRECLDHVVVFNETSLRRTLSAYCGYYHNWRTHLSLGKDAPEARRVQFFTEGKVVEMPAVGGLHHRYERRAA
jgi:putative transposase